MANETELERMVVRLIGDSEQYTKMLKDAEQATVQSTGNIDKAVSAMNAGTVAIGTMAAHVIEDMASTLRSFAKDAIASYLTYENSEIKLRSALENNRRNVDKLYASYKKFTKELSNVANTSTVATYEMLQLAESMGITGKQAERAVKNAVGLGAVKGIDPQAFIRMTVALEQGSTTMLTRFLPALRQIKDESERASKAQEMLSKMFGTAEALANSTSGRIEKLEKAIGGIKKEYGKMATEALSPVIDLLIDTAKWMQSLSDRTKATIGIIGGFTIVLGGVTPVLATVISGLTDFVQLWPSLKKSFATVAAGASDVMQVIRILGSQSYVWLTALKAGLVALALYGVYVLSQKVLELAGNFAELEREAKRAEQFTRGFQSRMSEGTQSTLKQAAGMDPGKRGSFLAEEIAAAKKEEEAYAGYVRKAEGDIKRIQGWWRSTWSSVYEDKQMKQMQGDLKEAQDNLEAAQKRTETLQKEFDKLKGPDLEQAKADLQSLSNELTKQIATFGMTTQEAELYRLSLLGLKEEQLAPVRQQLQTLKGMEDAKKLDEMAKAAFRAANTVNMAEGQIVAYDAAVLGADAVQQKWITDTYAWIEAQKKAATEAEDLARSVKNLEESLQTQINTFGMTATETEIYKLKLKGATDEQLRMARAASTQLKGLEDQKKLMEKGKEITEKYASPLDKLIKTKSDLNEMLKAGAISQEVYNKALRDAEQQAHKDYTVQFKTAGVDALLKGSKEVQQAMYDYQLGRTPIPREQKKPFDVANMDRRFVWEGKDNTRVNGGNTGPMNPDENMEQTAIRKALEDLLYLAKEHWTGDKVVLSNMGIEV